MNIDCKVRVHDIPMEMFEVFAACEKSRIVIGTMWVWITYDNDFDFYLSLEDSATYIEENGDA
jgi:hypothetical protein